jgi:hypothetical protein
VNARELLDSLSAIPGVRSARAEVRDIAESHVVGGIEVARATVVDERPLRRAWRDRADGGQMPLLLLTDDPENGGAVRALGPRDPGGPVRAVGAEDLLRVLERLPGLSDLMAVRELAQELDRLDRSGVAGLVVKGLGTEHLLGERVRRSARWARLTELGQPARGDWREVLTALGYQLERRSGRAGGWIARFDGRPVLVVAPVASPAALSRLDSDGRPPEGILLNACRAEGAPYGLLASGSRLRLFEAAPATGSAAARYLEMDSATLPAEDRPLLGLLAPEYLARGGFDELMEEARRFGARLSERIDRAIRQQVLPVLARELGAWARREGIDVRDDSARAELEAAALTFVFRALFLLYAESAGHLPVAQEAYRPHALSQLVREAHEGRDRLGASSVTLWRRVQTLVEVMRTGDPAWGVPAYNGALFASDGFAGATTLERATVRDGVLGPALAALGIDPETGAGADYSGLAIGHLGHIYEGLLSLRLSVADRPYAYDPGADRYTPVESAEAEVAEGELVWMTDEGGRKGGGVYYTPEALVRHLVRTAVMPAFERHLERVEALRRDDPAGAAAMLFEFRVLDPACGSAHFLVVVVDELADRVARFLAEGPLPDVQRQLDDLRSGAGEAYGVEVEDVALLRRLVLKRCVYGVDLSPMGAEIAKVSLWLASFVPGLALSYLDHNVRVGNSLVGVASPDEVLEVTDAGGQVGLVAQYVRDAVMRGAETAAELFELSDRTPEEVEASVAADLRARERVSGARQLLDLWTAGALGLDGAHEELEQRADQIAAGASSILDARASALCADQRTLHWPLEFPEVFSGRTPGFDAVVGNPPWEEVMLEELAFYARYAPGLRALPEPERMASVAELQQRRPELRDWYELEWRSNETLRRFFSRSPGYTGGAGHPDLYRFFCQRYRQLLTEGGKLGVVLPRSALAAKGSTDFRRWLFESSTVRRLDFLVNRRQWMFQTSPRYTVALVCADGEPPPPGHAIAVAGVADSGAAFARQAAGPGLALPAEALGPAREVPLLPSQEAADLLARLRAGQPFPFGTGRWRCFAIQELNETFDRELWKDQTEGWELWKGGSFYQYEPHGINARRCPASDAAMAKARKPRPGTGSLLAADVPVAERAVAVAAEVGRARVAFRDISRGVDPRTIIACLIPHRTFLTNKAPYLAFVDGTDLDRAACLGLLNSLCFDWQARRFVEINVNFFILEGLGLPALSDADYAAIARAAARLSCPDERFADFAAATGVEHGPLTEDDRERLIVEVDALVARAYGLDAAQLEVVLADFTLAAVSEEYRERLRGRFAELREC